MAKKKIPDQRKLQTLLTRIETAENWRDRNYRDKWTAWYKMWRNHVDQLKDKNGKPIKDRSNISVPYAFTMLETVLPRLVVTLFAGRPYVTVKGIPFSLDEYRRVAANGLRPWDANAEKMQKLLDYQQNVTFDMQDEFYTGLKILALYGTAVSYTGWKLSERSIIRKELLPVTDEDGQPITEADGVTPVMDFQPVQISKKEYDDPEVKFLDLGLFYVDSNAEDIDDARYAGHVEYLSKPQLQELEDQGQLSIDWGKVPKNNVRNEARNHRMNAVGIPVDGALSLDDTEDMDLYEVHHYWEDDRYAVLINRGYIARDSENPFWHKKKPYDKDVYTKVPNEFHGIGLMEVAEDLQLELNTERNQRIDYRSFSMRRMFKSKRNADINPAELVWRQGGVIHVDEEDDVTTFDAPDTGVGASFNQEEQIKQDLRDVTGAQDVVIGTSGGSNTATETMTKDNNASVRFKLIITSVENRLLVAISRKMIQLNQQFIEDIRLLPLFDEEDQDWPEISPEDIQGEFHLIAAGSSVEPIANQEAFKQRMVELFGIVAKDPFMEQFPVKRRNLLKKVFEAFDITDTDELLPTDDELSGMMEQQLFVKIMAGLPPQVQQLILQYLGQASTGQPAGAPEQTQPPDVGGGTNTAAMQEQGLPMQGGVAG